MNVKELKNENGSLSGIMIPANDFSELKNSVKSGTPLYTYLDSLLIAATDENHEEITLENGLSIAETNKRSALFTEALYRQAFEKNVPVYYQDERTSGPDEFIRANPDGSEDLVLYDFENDTRSLLKNLIPPAKGQFAYLA
jgi:hypothetical protein